MTPGPDDLEVVRPSSRGEWRAWLERNHETSPPIRLAVAKRRSKVPGVTYEEAIEEALAFGWVDSTAGKLDEDAFTVLMARRKRGSTWARTNRDRVERLTAEERMASAGIAAVDAARADGSWSALDDIDALVVPSDLAAALAADPVAEANFRAFPDSAKRMVLYRLASARRPETRAKRVAESVADARANIRRVTP